MLFFHDGVSSFPHGAGASEVGWYWYPGGVVAPEPLGPFSSRFGAAWAGFRYWLGR